jgi:hypothetical protein
MFVVGVLNFCLDEGIEGVIEVPQERKCHGFGFVNMVKDKLAMY